MHVGIRLYKIQVYNEHKPKELSAGNGPEGLGEHVRKLVEATAKKPINDGTSKTLRFESKPDDGYSQHGLIWYGTYGYGAQIEDVGTGTVSYNRSVNEADTIHLYYRFWLPPGYSYGIAALQAFGGRSCAEIALNSVVNSHALKWPEYRVTAKKLMPNDRELYGGRQVKRIQLVRKRAKSNIVDQALRPIQGNAEIDVETTLKARGSSNFGMLKDLDNKLGGHLEIGGLEFERAYAEVKVGNSYKKIGVLGSSNNAGVVDVSDEIVRSVDQHPTFDSISKVTKQHVTDFAKMLGK